MNHCCCSSCDGGKQECRLWRQRRWQLRPRRWSIQSILCCYVYSPPWLWLWRCLYLYLSVSVSVCSSVCLCLLPLLCAGYGCFTSTNILVGGRKEKNGKKLEDEDLGFCSQFVAFTLGAICPGHWICPFSICFHYFSILNNHNHPTPTTCRDEARSDRNVLRITNPTMGVYLVNLL